MTHTTHRGPRTLVTTVLRRALPATAVVLLTAAPAHARATADAGLLDDWLQLSVTKGTPRSSDTRGTLLLCDPPQGHSRATEACAQLTEAEGDLSALRPDEDAVCALVYAPVTVRAEGSWHGRPVRYEETFANTCRMAATTGAVFALDG
ncbi:MULTISPECIES: SSI family serine proteinase inhibitor [unclassified Streptomyces]|uniref:SSI family serine proteinase inhibitor n=1 Tax=unclassified Streptomyces TaxID=2593676 RepID=UPI003D72F9E3